LTFITQERNFIDGVCYILRDQKGNDEYHRIKYSNVSYSSMIFLWNIEYVVDDSFIVMEQADD
jgi:hypothetical protein